MSESFFQELGISAPDYNLDTNKGLHCEQTGRMLMAVEQAMLDERQDLIIVFGDTNKFITPFLTKFTGLTT